ncbi:MAG TPA: methyltransferase domain-containing protein [Alphaproteobacteria bacterium]|nr:methyltransferase domain-containing protein [Alphaproteobacteria bacterium]
MADLFEEKAQDWDQNEMVTQLAAGIGAAVLGRVDFHSDMEVMDFGAGTGLISGHVASKVGKITAVDVSESMLEQLAAKPELQGKVRTVCQDITRQALGEEFDVIVSAMAMHHVEDTDNLASTFAEHLKPGGMVALADLDKEDGTFHPEDTEGVYHSGFDRDAMKAILEKNGFGNVEFVTAHTVNKETGDYPVFLVTARKQ